MPPGLQRAAPWVAAFSTLAVGACAWPYTVDDAYIVARYATHLATGHGYTLSGNSPSDGVTGPLWLVPGWLAARVGLDPVIAAKALGLACMAAAAAIVVARLRGRAGGRVAASIAALLFAVQPTLGTWGVGGLETGAATLAVTCAIVSATRARVQLAALAMALGALPWLRPELAPVACVLLVAAALRDAARARVAAAVFVASLLATCAFRYALFDALLPLAFHAKLGTPADGVRYAATSVVMTTGGAGVLLAVAAGKLGRSDDRVIAWLLATHVLAVIAAGGDWMPGFRLLAPLVPVYVGLVALGAQRLALRSARTRRIACALLALAAALPALDLALRVDDIAAAAQARDTRGRELAVWLRAHALRVALVDIGYLGTASGVDVVDLGGITDREIAALRGGHLDKHVTDELLARRAPDTLVLHAFGEVAVDGADRLLALPGAYPVERRVAQLAWVRREFRVKRIVSYAPDYVYVVLQRPR